MKEMHTNNNDCWYGRVSKMKTLLSVDNFPSMHSLDSIGNKIKKKVQSQFSSFWKREVSREKLHENGANRNKLHFYQTLKSSFTIEPYLQLVCNRNQRAWLTRIRISAHSLHIETGRYKGTPLNERLCKFCNLNKLDDEYHFCLICPTFLTKRNCLFGKLSSINPYFPSLNNNQKLSTLLCPTNPKSTKLINKFISIVCKARSRIDNGDPMDIGGFTDHDLNDSDLNESGSQD